MSLALLSGLASFLAFANPFVRLPFLVVCVPWTLALMAKRTDGARAAFKWGWIAGSLAATASLYWIVLPVHTYGFLPWPLAVPCPILVGMVLGIYPGLFCAALHLTKRSMRPLAWGLFAALVWTALEALRGWLFSGFPWLPLAVAFAPWPVAIQSVSIIGAFGLSGILAACGVWLAGPGAAPRAATAVTLALLAGYGLWALQAPVPVDGRFNAAMIQGNVDQGIKWEPDTLDKIIHKYSVLSQKVMPERPDILIWPETALTFFVQQKSVERTLVDDFIRTLGIPLVAGAPGYERGNTHVRVFNRAYLFGSQGLEGFYDKEHLVPFGEYAPFGQDIPLLASLMKGVGAFTPGTNTAPLVSGRLAMGMLICYEAIFPRLARDRVAAGANVLVNISNDAWFGRSSAPGQHLELAALRAVEQRRFLLRCTNTGITALIDPQGRVTHETPLFADAAVSVSGVGLISAKTIYYHIEGWLEALCALAALLLLAWTAIVKKGIRGK